MIKFGLKIITFAICAYELNPAVCENLIPYFAKSVDVSPIRCISAKNGKKRKMLDEERSHYVKVST